MQRIGCDVSLASNDRPNTLSLRRLVELDRAIEIAMISDRNCWHTAFGGLPDEILCANSTIKQGVLSVTMQMNKRDSSHRIKPVSPGR